MVNCNLGSENKEMLRKIAGHTKSGLLNIDIIVFIGHFRRNTNLLSTL